MRAFLSEVHHISNLYFMIFMMVSYFYMIFLLIPLILLQVFYFLSYLTNSINLLVVLIVLDIDAFSHLNKCASATGFCLPFLEKRLPEKKGSAA